MTASNGSAHNTPELLTFPCEIDIKVFVHAGELVEQHVQALLLKHLEPNQLLGLRRKISRHGKYHSLSCRIVARSRHELDQLYAALSGCPDILMVL